MKIYTLILLIILQIISIKLMAADKHALLIAIEDYSQTPFNSLKGPINDILITKYVLTQRFDFEDKDFIIIKILLLLPINKPLIPVLKLALKN